MRPYSGAVYIRAQRLPHFGRGPVKWSEPRFELRGSSYEKAVEYARWLAARDGIELSTVTPDVEHRSVSLSTGRGVDRASAVIFGTVRIEIPHTDYDPTRPAVELEPDDNQDDIFEAAASCRTPAPMAHSEGVFG